MFHQHFRWCNASDHSEYACNRIKRSLWARSITRQIWGLWSGWYCWVTARPHALVPQVCSRQRFQSYTFLIRWRECPKKIKFEALLRGISRSCTRLGVDILVCIGLNQKIVLLLHPSSMECLLEWGFMEYATNRNRFRDPCFLLERYRRSLGSNLKDWTIFLINFWWRWRFYFV